MSVVEFNKSKCWILHLGWSNARHRHKLGEEGLESSPADRDLSAAAHQKPAVCPGSLEVKLHPGGPPTQLSQPSTGGDYQSGGDYPTESSLGEASPPVLCAVLGPAVWM